MTVPPGCTSGIVSSQPSVIPRGIIKCKQFLAAFGGPGMERTMDEQTDKRFLDLEGRVARLELRLDNQYEATKNLLSRLSKLERAFASGSPAKSA